MKIQIWHGLTQKVGHLGEAQDDFNLMGRIVPMGENVSLSYALNGGSPIALTIGNRPDGFGDGRRLAGTGHFNADIPIRLLNRGVNEVVLTAKDNQANIVRETVRIERRDGSCNLPVYIDWSMVKDPQDVGQYVDGEWKLRENGLRTMHTGYDRIFLIGEESWRDYEITVPLVINDIDEVVGPRSGNNAAAGILMRFTGHVVGGPLKFAPGQPKWGYQPFGAICWLSWVQGMYKPPQKQFYPGDSGRVVNYGDFAVNFGRVYWIKTSCETLPDDASGYGVTRYSFRIWSDGQAEPRDWDWQETQASEYALRQGGVVLLAHHADVTFGNITIKAL